MLDKNNLHLMFGLNDMHPKSLCLGLKQENSKVSESGVSNNNPLPEPIKSSENASSLMESKYNYNHYELRRIREFLKLYKGLKKEGFMGQIKPLVVQLWMNKELEFLHKIGTSNHPYPDEELI